MTARENLIMSNLPMVEKLAGKYARKGGDYDDLYQEGVCGLLEAADHYESDKGNFGTYANYWILKRVREEYHRSVRHISMSAETSRAVFGCFRAKRELQGELGRLPSVEEIAESVGLSPKVARKMLTVYGCVAELDRQLNRCTLGDSICEDATSRPTEDAVLTGLEKEIINTPGVYLHKRERITLMMHTGLSDGVNYTFKEIGSFFGVTAAMTRNYYHSAVDKIRAVVAST